MWQLTMLVNQPQMQRPQTVVPVSNDEEAEVVLPNNDEHNSGWQVSMVNKIRVNRWTGPGQLNPVQNLKFLNF